MPWTNYLKQSYLYSSSSFLHRMLKHDITKNSTSYRAWPQGGWIYLFFQTHGGWVHPVMMDHNSQANITPYCPPTHRPEYLRTISLSFNSDQFYMTIQYSKWWKRDKDKSVQEIMMNLDEVTTHYCGWGSHDMIETCPINDWSCSKPTSTSRACTQGHASFSTPK